MYLMSSALDVIQRKGVELSQNDWLGALLAILLHDVGHGPFSHTLENVFVNKMSHERLSLIFMKELNRQFSLPVLGVPLLPTAAEERRYARWRALEWAGGTILMLAVLVAEFCVYRYG